MFQLRVVTGHHRCHFTLRSKQCLCPDRDETAAQEGSQRRRVAWRDLRKRRLAPWDQCQCLFDQTPTGTSASSAERLDRHLQTTDEPTPDRDESCVVTMDTDVSSVRPRSHHSGMILQIRSLTQAPPTDTSSHQHGVVTSDPTVRSDEPPEYIGLRCPTESIGALREHMLTFEIGEHDAVPRELDNRMMITRHRGEHLDRPVDLGESPLGSVEEDAVEFVHAVRDYGRIMRADVMTN